METCFLLQKYQLEIKFCVLSLAETVHECFVLKKKSGEETPMMQESTVQKAIADWLRYAAARVKKTVSVINYNCLKFTIFLAFLLQSVYLNGLVAALLLCGGLLSLTKLLIQSLKLP